MPQRRDMLRLGLAAAAVCLALPVRAKQAPAAQQGGFISRKLNAPVPGGVAVLALGDAATAPEVTYRDRRVLVVREDGKQWIAVVGIPLAVKPGQQEISVRDGAGTRQLPFTVRAKEYVAQHITLKLSLIHILLEVNSWCSLRATLPDTKMPRWPMLSCTA